MQAAARKLAPPPDPWRIDQRVTLHGVSWEAYEALAASRGESSVPRMTYLEGELELMTPSLDHDEIKTKLGRIIESWAVEMDIVLEGAGSWTVRKKSVKRGAEADECYILGPYKGQKAPDIAIEVVWTRGGIDKLEVWRKLGAREVWIWEAGALSFHVLRGGRYVRAAKSTLLPLLDPTLLARCMAADTQTGAVRMMLRAVRSKRSRKR